MKISDQISLFIRDTESRMRTCIDRRLFEIVMSLEAYKLLRAESDRMDTMPQYAEVGYAGTLLGYRLIVDADAKDAFAFVSDYMKLTPPENNLRKDNVVEETRRQHSREAEMVRGFASLRDLIFVMRYEASAFRDGMPMQSRSRIANIAPVDCDKLADLFSAVADNLEKRIQEGAEK